MKILFAILFGCLSIVQNGIAQSSTTQPSSASYCTEAGPSCYDCNTLQYCSDVGNANLDFTVSCKVQNPNRPYCDKTKVECVADDVCELEPVASETCYNNGTRPDPTDCTRYVQCAPKSNGVGFIGSAVKCPKGTVFSAALGKCVTSTQCITIKQYCTAAKAGKIISYPPYPSSYAKCPANANEEIVVKLCKGEYIFNEQNGVCEPICRREGYIPNNLNCKAYYNCVRNSNGVYSITSNVCPTDTVFNPVTKLCDDSATTCTPLGRSLLPRRKRDLLTISGY